MNWKIPTLMLGLAILAPSSAMAASASATFDWSQAAFLTYGNISYTWDTTNVVSGWAYGSYDSDTGALPLSASAAAGGASASATQSQASWSANASATHAGDRAYANSNRYGNVSISGNGVLVITVPYTISVSAVGGGSSWSEVQIGSDNYNGANSSGNYAWVQLSSDAGTRSSAGLLSLALYSPSGYAGRLYAQAMASAHVPAVPEPSSYAMMLSGLALVGALARRQKRS